MVRFIGSWMPDPHLPNSRRTQRALFLLLSLMTAAVPLPLLLAAARILLLHLLIAEMMIHYFID
jgi:hypothetical protein